jgi:hypothetical protein
MAHDVGASSSHAILSPSLAPFQAPSSSHGPLPTHGATHTLASPKAKQGTLFFLLKDYLLASTCGIKMLKSLMI